MRPLLWVTTNDRLMWNCLNMFLTPKLLPNTVCVPVSVKTSANDYSAVSVPSFTHEVEKWSAALFRVLYFTYWWTRGPLKAIWSSFTSNPLDSDRARASRWAGRAALPPSSLRTLPTPASNLQSRVTASAGLDYTIQYSTAISVAWAHILLKAATAWSAYHVTWIVITNFYAVKPNFSGKTKY